LHHIPIYIFHFFMCVHLYTRVKLCESLIELRRLFCEFDVVADDVCCTVLFVLFIMKLNDLVDKKLSFLRERN